MEGLHCAAARSLPALRTGSLVTAPLAFNSDMAVGKGWCDQELQQVRCCQGGVRCWLDEARAATGTSKSDATTGAASSWPASPVHGWLRASGANSQTELVSPRRDAEGGSCLSPPPPSLALTQDLADAGVMHVREGLQNLPPLVLRPHHEGVHGPLDVVVVPGLGEVP